MLVSDAVPVDIPRHRMNDITTQPQQDIPKLYRAELPNSQDSIVSAASSTFSAPILPSTLSTLSNSTTTDVEITSSATSYVPSSQTQPSERAAPPSPKQPRDQDELTTPPIDAVDAPRTGGTAASPMLLDAPTLVQGSKRTASGMVKGSGSIVDGPLPATGGHKRTKSTDSGSNPRIGQLSAQLRTRLSYAMVKVQNGWEKKSLDDIEDETSQRGSPISAPSRSESVRGPFGSPRDFPSQRRPSAISDSSDQMMLSPRQASAPDASRPMAATSSFWHSYSGPTANGSSGENPENSSMNGSVLAPAAEIGSRRKRRSSASFNPPSLLGAGQRKYYSDLGAGPHTPGSGAPRAGILRMPSQQAEKDAVDTLLFMSSPNNTGRLPHTSSDRLPKGGLPARRVMFESDIRNEQTVTRHHNGYNPSDLRRPSYAGAEPDR